MNLLLCPAVYYRSLYYRDVYVISPVSEERDTPANARKDQFSGPRIALLSTLRVNFQHIFPTPCLLHVLLASLSPQGEGLVDDRVQVVLLVNSAVTDS